MNLKCSLVHVINNTEKESKHMHLKCSLVRVINNFHIVYHNTSKKKKKKNQFSMECNRIKFGIANIVTKSSMYSLI